MAVADGASEDADADAEAAGDARPAPAAAPAAGPPPPAAAGDFGVAGVDKHRLHAPSAAPKTHRTGDAHVVFVCPPGEHHYSAGDPLGPYPLHRYGYGGGAWGSWTGGTGGLSRGGGGGRDGGGGGGGGPKQGLDRWLMLDDDEWVDMGPFSSKAARRAFVIKVYAMLTLQLAITGGVIALFVFEPTVQKFAKKHLEMYILSFVGFLVAFAVLLFCGETRRRLPWNVILLVLFALSFAYVLGMASAYHTTYVVLMTVSITVVISLVITVAAIVTKVDLTGCGSLLCVLLLGHLIFGFMLAVVFIVWGPTHLLTAFFAGIVGNVFSLYLMFDTQLIMGGKHMELSKDEYVFATMMLFVDIADLFWTLLMTFGFCCGE